MKRYDIEMNGDDMLTEEAPDGRWVEASEVDAHVAKLAATFDELSSGYLARAEAAEAELQKERNRRVEHVQMNKTLNEANQRLAKRLRWAEGRLAGPRCECCASLCVDLAKDERGFCPSCSSIPEPTG